MTPGEIEAARRQAREAKRRAEEATPGPWLWSDRAQVDPAEAGYPKRKAALGEHAVGGIVSEFHTHVVIAYAWCCQTAIEPDISQTDRAFIVSVRSDVPALADSVLSLADEVERLRAENAEARDLLANTPFGSYGAYSQTGDNAAGERFGAWDERVRALLVSDPSTPSEPRPAAGDFIELDDGEIRLTWRSSGSAFIEVATDEGQIQDETVSKVLHSLDASELARLRTWLASTPSEPQ